ncbi:chitin synthase [Malassezia nana]|uniref:chitin synthase n=1 Tax=Malassezia nana TaxID=180528 RepID=A0AAF0ELA6_9BASI|nr:chitin synthase [Malassezia nana]
MTSDGPPLRARNECSPKSAPLTCHGHTRPVVHLEHSDKQDDGTYMLLSSCKDGSPMLRDWLGDWVGTFLVWSAKMSGGEAARAATGSADFSAKIWDTYTGECLHTFSHSHIVRSVALDANAQTLLTGGNEKKLRLFDLGKPPADAAGAQLFRTKDNGTTHEGLIRSVVLGRGVDTAHTIVTASEEKLIQWWDLRTMEPTHDMILEEPFVSMERCAGSFGEYITIAAGHDAWFVDLGTHEVVRRHTLPITPSSISLQPTTADTFVAGCTADEWVRIYHYADGSERDLYKGHHGPVHCVSYSPDGEVAASGSEDGCGREFCRRTTLTKHLQRVHPPHKDKNARPHRGSVSAPLRNVQPRPPIAPMSRMRPEMGAPLPETHMRWAPPPMFQPLPPNVPMSAPLMGRFVLNTDMPPPPESAPLLHQPALLPTTPMGLPPAPTPVYLHGPPPMMTPMPPAAPMMPRPTVPMVSSSPSFGYASTSTTTSPSSFMSPAVAPMPTTPLASRITVKKDEEPFGPFALDEDVKPIATAPGSFVRPTDQGSMSGATPTPMPAAGLRRSDIDDEMVTRVCHRYYQSLYYTQVQESVLLVTNPYEAAIEANSEDVLRAYKREFRDSRLMVHGPQLPAHIFRTACNAYFYMQRTGQDQCLFFLGETASGKSESRRLTMRALASVSSALPGKRGARLATQLPAALYVLECMGHIWTEENANASAMALYTELQFNQNGRLIGFKMLPYYLELARVSPLRLAGRPFHLFGLLVAGATPEDRQRWRLDSASLRLLGSEHVRGQDEAGRAAAYRQWCEALTMLGLSATQRTEMLNVLAAILHLGDLEFVHDDGLSASARVVSEESLYIAASLLGVGASALAHALTHLTSVVQGQLCTALLQAEQAAESRDRLMRTLYTLLFAWLNEHMHACFAHASFDTYIGLLDLPGHRNRLHNHLETFAINLAADTVQRHMMHVMRERRLGELNHEGLSHLAPLPSAEAESGAERLRVLTHYPGGLVHIMDDQTRRRPRKNSQTMVEAMQRRWVHHAALEVERVDRLRAPRFLVTHFHGTVAYEPHGWLSRNDESLALEHVSLLRGAQKELADGASGFGSSSAFVRGLFRYAPSMQLPTPPPPRPAPSTKRLARSGTLRAAASREPRDDDVYGGALHEPSAVASDAPPCVLGTLQSSLHTLLEVLDEAKAWFILCVRPNTNALANQCEPSMMRRQLEALGASQLRVGHESDYSVTLTFTEFCDRYGALPPFDAIDMLGVPPAEAKMRVSDAIARMNWTDAHVAMGLHKVFLSHAVFRELEDYLRATDPEEMQYQVRKASADDDEAAQASVDPYSPYKALPSRVSLSPEPAPLWQGWAWESERQSLLGDVEEGPFLDDAKDGGPGEAAPAAGPPVMERLRVTAERRLWVALTWACTFWVPTVLLRLVPRLRRPDVRMAWREKLAINMIIWFICLCSIFVIVFLGNVVCPRQHVYSVNELSGHKGSDAFTAIRGEVFDLHGIIGTHLSAIPVVSRKTLMQYAGEDATSIFPVQVNALCRGPNGPISPWVTLDAANNTDPNARYHDFRAYQATDVRPDWYYEQMWFMRSRYRVGFVGYTPKEIQNMLEDGRTIGVYDGYIYDLTTYVGQGNQGAFRMPEGVAPPPNLDRTILDPNVVQLFTQNPGRDVRAMFDAMAMPAAKRQDQATCLRNLFLIGRVDERSSPRCTFSSYILLALSILMVLTVGFKFFAALQFVRSTPPEDHEKFVVCQIPCYTEGAESVRKTINSIARLRYDDRRKLLVIICDGYVTGAGNDAPTPQIVLEVLGADPDAETEPRSFVSLGEGMKQHNMARVYSGLYEHAGHLVPYLVIAKCGSPSETMRPGNRGKRDSQLILMRFFNKVHYGAAMSPLELELYHHIKNVIGVNPSFYEYLLQVDADTEVEPSALARMVAFFVRDKKVVGLCGETALANEHQSLTTMLQVYEYYISHYLVKAFESLFGSITCLPGCFSMFRFRAPDSQRPLFVSNAVLDDYCENRVDTLHLKNLLYLGEDRYLTTLVLKHFPEYKTQFVQHARCWTIAPDSWRVLLSQRRRWINSTVHNLVELLKTPQLCGFCLFSMRFVVLIDLVSTIVAPVTIGYIVYLIIVVAVDGGTIPMTSIVMLAGIYGLQAIIFLLHRRFDMIGWMIVYLLGLPLWSLVLPLYSFWRMDDFSWGNTRIVTGDKGEKLLVHDEGHFDPRTIPHMTWDEYERELWEHRAPPSADLTSLPHQSMSSVSPWPTKPYSDTPWTLPDDMSLAPDDASAKPSWAEPSDVLDPLPPSEVPWPSTTPYPERPPARLPPNEVLRHDIRQIIASGDLTSMTKRQVRAQLQDLYGCSLHEKKAYINAQIEAALRDL